MKAVASVWRGARSLALEDALILGLTLGLCVAHGLSLLIFPSFTPRMSLLLAAGVPGLFYLLRSARYRDRAAAAAVVVLMWILVAALLGDAPRLALVGTIGREMSGLIVALSLGVWALGRGSSRRSAELLPWALVIGLGLNALVGVVQIVAGLETGAFALQSSRATGLTPNPVYFGALMATGAAIAASHPTLARGQRLGLVMLFGVAVNLSGSRVGLAAGLVAVCVAAGAGLRSNPKRWAELPGAYVLGVVLGGLLAAITTGGRSSTDRLVTSPEGGGRTTAWRYGLEAILDRPVWGWGFGRFRAATQHRFSPEFVRESAADDLTQAWFDPHNVVVTVGVAIGLVGLVLVAVWVVLAARWASGPLVAPLVALGLIMLLQPAGLAVVPLAMFLLGGAARIARPADRVDSSLGLLVPLLIGVALAGWLAIGDLRLQAAAEVGRAAEIESAARWFPRDAVVSDLVAQAWYIEEESDPTLRPKVFEWSERAVSAEPDRPYFWRQHGIRLFVLGRSDEAIEAFESALELQPWHLQSWRALYAVGELLDDVELRDRAHAKLCRLGAPIGDDPC